ncbi:MAG: hypothetical protein K6E42_03520 [Synergistes sp.]|nr:hypothetical protein [Synergistes sp.]
MVITKKEITEQQHYVRTIEVCMDAFDRKYYAAEISARDSSIVIRLQEADTLEINSIGEETFF